MKISYIEECMEREGYTMSELAVCKGDSTFSFIRPQYKENLKFSKELGVWSEKEEFVDICLNTVKIAKKNAVDLLLTPEYSMPYSVLEEIVNNIKLRPDYGKLWCLCFQGITVQDFGKRIKGFKAKSIVIEEAIKNITGKKFVNALFYIFINDDNKLILVPQIKVHSMADANLECEKSGMSYGEIVFKFGKDKKNQLLTLMCADVFGTKSCEIINGNENIILLHPQLNSKPRHEDFCQLRNESYSQNEFKDMVYITANWAKGTVLLNEDDVKCIEVKNPWTAIYRKKDDCTWIEDEKSLREDNLQKAIGFAYYEKKRLGVWYNYTSEIMHIMYIKSPTYKGIISANKINPDVKVEEVYLRDGSTWIREVTVNLDDNLESLIGADEDKYSFPLVASKADRDNFFGISLGTFKEELYLDFNECSKNTGTYVDEESEDIREKNITRFKKLKAKLKNCELPIELDKLNKNHKFMLKSNKYNVTSSDGSHEMDAMIAYADNEKEAKIILEEFVSRRKKEQPNDSSDLHKLMKELMYFEENKKYCVSYRDVDDKLKFLPERNEKQTNPDREVNQNSITR